MEELEVKEETDSDYSEQTKSKHSSLF